MKLVSYSKNSTISCGILLDNQIIDIPSAFENAPHSVLEVLERGPEMLKQLEEIIKSKSKRPVIPLSSVKLLAPILRPPKSWRWPATSASI